MWQLNESYIAGTSEYIWYVTATHNAVLCIKCDTKVNNSTDIEIPIEQLHCRSSNILSYQANIPETIGIIANIFKRIIYLTCIF